MWLGFTVIHWSFTVELPQSSGSLGNLLQISAPKSHIEQMCCGFMWFRLHQCVILHHLLPVNKRQRCFTAGIQQCHKGDSSTMDPMSGFWPPTFQLAPTSRTPPAPPAWRNGMAYDMTIVFHKEVTADHKQGMKNSLTLEGSTTSRAKRVLGSPSQKSKRMTYTLTDMLNMNSWKTIWLCNHWKKHTQI